MTDLRAADVECLVVTGDNPECGYYLACCAGFLDSGVPVLLGEKTASNLADDVQNAGHNSENTLEDTHEPVVAFDTYTVSWTRIGNDHLHDHGPPLNTAELLATLATDNDGEDQGKINYALVITGPAWDMLRHDRGGLASPLGSPRSGERLAGKLGDNELQRLVSHVKVAARFSPGQKEDIVQALAAKGRTVAMIGDGGNDCAALRAAHVGLALNGAEASMVSPFSSKQRSIHAVLALLLEGRCALTTSFAGYKFLVLQGLTLATAGVS